MAPPSGPPTDVASVLARLKRPSKAVVTAGMPYANGPLHLGHLAGAQLPADIYSRWLGMLIGRKNVLFVNGTDDHGSTSEVAALKVGKTAREFIDGIHPLQKQTLERFNIGVDTYSGTSRPETYPTHKALSQEFLLKLNANGLLQKRTSKQWFDAKASRFLPDRLVVGTCPNCGDEKAYSDECDKCGKQYAPTELINPKSTITGETPEMRDTTHWWLDMWAVSDTLREWIQTKQKTWRPAVLAAVLETVMPSLKFSNVHEPAYKELKATLPKHKSKYAAGKKVQLQFENKTDLETANAALKTAGFEPELANEWAYRSITRDIAWGIPVPDVEKELAGKTLYVWPDSLIAPIAFTQTALTQQGRDPKEYEQFWKDPNARVVQFLGQDNVFFYVLMQGAMWLGSQANPHRMPVAGEFQMTDIFGCCHLKVSGEKMSKSRGTFYTGDQLVNEMGYSVDQIRYFLALLDLTEKPADFDLKALDERNKFLAGPMNASFEKPLSAAHSKFGGKVPDGKLNEKVVAETVKLVQRYTKSMDKAEYANLLFEIENYARTINSLFTQHKPHDDRFPLEARQDALFTSFYVLKNLLIMLYPFVPATMEKLRESLRLPADVYRLEELGQPMPAGHEVGMPGEYFPKVAEAPAEPQA